MNKYLVATCHFGNLPPDILMAYLHNMGFDSFEERNEEIDAYVSMEHDTNQIEIELNELAKKLDFTFSTKILEPKNWNDVWEANFEPVIVEKQILIRADFHDKDTTVKYEIVISPKMAFGTGHHETTYLMLKHMLDADLKAKTVLDYGSGTGILSIAASLLGADHIDAVDIQKEAEDNAIEHMALNQVYNMSIFTGDLTTVPKTQYDIILANINRNVILSTMKDMKDLLKPEGLLFISGILAKDKKLVLNKAENSGLQLLNIDQKGEWLFFRFLKV